jgi:hypothetical protein
MYIFHLQINTIMKKIISTSVLFFIAYTCIAQATYYIGEWTVKDKPDLFTCVCKIEIQSNGIVKGELIWTFISIDKSNKELAESYKGKEGKSGIEYVQGVYKTATNDIYLETTKLTDPWKILGSTKYYLKLTVGQKEAYGIADEKELYGVTADVAGEFNGYFFALKKQLTGEQDFHRLKYKIESE